MEFIPSNLKVEREQFGEIRNIFSNKLESSVKNVDLSYYCRKCLRTGKDSTSFCEFCFLVMNSYPAELKECPYCTFMYPKGNDKCPLCNQQFIIEKKPDTICNNNEGRI